MVVQEQEWYEVVAWGDEDAPQNLEHKSLESQVARRLGPFHVPSMVDDAWLVVILEHIEEDVVVVAADWIIIESTKVRNDVHCHVTDNRKVHIDACEQDEGVHHFEKVAGNDLACSEPEGCVLEVKARGMIIDIFHNIHSVHKQRIYGQMHSNRRHKLRHEQWEVHLFYWNE